MEPSEQSLYTQIEMVDYLVSIYNLAYLISTQGWLTFVEKSPINRIVDCRCIVNRENFSQIILKLSHKVSELQEHL